MRITDAAPSATLRPTAPSTTGAATGPGFVETFGSVQRAFRQRRPPPLHEIPERQDRRRQLEARAQRLESAARALSEAGEGRADARAESRIETRQDVLGDDLTARVSEFAAAYNELRRFADDSHLDVGDDYGLIGNDVRVKRVLSALDELATGLVEARREGEAGLAGIGVALDESGELRLDADALQRAVAADAGGVRELLNGRDGLGALAAGALEPAAAEPADGGANLRGFLASLSTEQGRLEARAGLLEGVVSALSQGPAPTADPSA